MKLEQINNIATTISNTGENKTTQVSIKLNGDKHEVLQQEVFRFINKTIHGYTSKRVFEVIINDVRFIINRG
jgi:hypothetical protein